MHMVGHHQKIEHEGEVILDAPFDFNEQRFYPIEPRTVEAGDRFDVTCTWLNPTGSGERTFGDGDSEDEMCFAGFYRYPRADSGVFCGVSGF